MQISVELEELATPWSVRHYLSLPRGEYIVLVNGTFASSNARLQSNDKIEVVPKTKAWPWWISVVEDELVLEISPVPVSIAV